MPKAHDVASNSTIHTHDPRYDRNHGAFDAYAYRPVAPEAEQLDYRTTIAPILSGEILFQGNRERSWVFVVAAPHILLRSGSGHLYTDSYTVEPLISSLTQK
jgi:hypothetical protein